LFYASSGLWPCGRRVGCSIPRYSFIQRVPEYPRWAEFCPVFFVLRVLGPLALRASRGLLHVGHTLEFVVPLMLR
jgi:hypothetical protein